VLVGDGDGAVLVGVGLGLCVGLGVGDAVCVARAAELVCAALVFVCCTVCTSAGAEVLRACVTARCVCVAAIEAGARGESVGPLAGAAEPPHTR